MMGEQWGRTGNMQFFTPEEWVAKMDEEGVAAVCVPSLKMAFYRAARWPRTSSTSTSPALCERAPGRVFGLAGIDPMSGMKGVKHLEQAVTEYGFVGAPRPPVRLRDPDQRARVVALLRQVRRARRPGRVPGRPLGGVHAERVREADPARRHRDLVPGAQARRRPHRLAVDRGADRDGLEAPERLHRHLRPRAEVLGPEARPVPQRAQPRDRQGHVGHRLPADHPLGEPRPDRRTSTSSPRPGRRCCTTRRRRSSSCRPSSRAQPAEAAVAAE